MISLCEICIDGETCSALFVFCQFGKWPTIMWRALVDNGFYIEDRPVVVSWIIMKCVVELQTYILLARIWGSERMEFNRQNS
jgi:hypothetical protein